MKTNVIYAYGKKCSRVNIIKEMVPTLFISVLFSSLIYGLCKLDLKLGILLCVALFLILSYCILPSAFENYWCIDENGITFAKIEKKERRKMIFSTLINKNESNMNHIDKKDINKIKLVYKKNTLIGPAKRNPDMFYALIFYGNKTKKIELTYVPENKIADIIKTLQTFCNNLDDENNIVYAITHNLNLYDFIYSNNTTTEK